MSERLFVRLDGDPLHAPETDGPAGTMREYAVAAPLRELVAHVAFCPGLFFERVVSGSSRTTG